MSFTTRLPRKCWVVFVLFAALWLYWILSDEPTHASGELGNELSAQVGASPAFRFPIRFAGYWARNSIGKEGDLVSRVAGADLAMDSGSPSASAFRDALAYFRFCNSDQQTSNEPVLASNDREFGRSIRQALTGLPPAIRKRASRLVKGIFPVRHLQSSALTVSILDPKHQLAGVFIALDQEALSRSANSWATWKENLPFLWDPSISITVKLEEKAHDNRVQALQYLLLHELGHAFAYDSGITPPFDLQGSVTFDPSQFEFSKISWVRHQEQYVSRFETEFPSRRKVGFYGSGLPKLPAREWVAVYAELLSSDFVSLYGATNLHDDFAESFANYVHVVMMKRPYEVRTLTIESVGFAEGAASGKKERVMAACWDEPRCEQKRKFLDEFVSSLKR